ncbi:MAG TPA: HAMP domain-containing sensor histidine kinase [Candidatus Caenarcaniphilales bacterium]|nr:HAMP domain-containing sensor histidine kinase [Candidatus Caenarcaniphilales bacterium]
MSSPVRGGIGLRIALAAVFVALVAVAILGVGVWVVGGETFAALMASHGEGAAAAHEMFDHAVTQVLLIAIGVAVVVAVVLAAFVGARLGRPLCDVGRAARSIAEGDYGARLPRRGSEELVSLADSFNQMVAALEEQERIRREFIANAAHELRTPLTNLQGYLEALRDSVITPDRQTFESLWEEADRLVRLSRSLDQLAVGDARELPPARAELDLAVLVRSAMDLARPTAHARGLELVVEAPERLVVHGNPDHLAQILSNLLHNATRYTPPGGRVTVRAETRSQDVLVSVVNTGDGIPTADLPHVFERFYRVEKSRDRQRGGAGIGLAIVRQLVESAGGRVGAESSPELTRFWFTLPTNIAGG